MCPNGADQNTDYAKMTRNVSDENADLGSIASHIKKNTPVMKAQGTTMADMTPPMQSTRQTVVSFKNTGTFLRTKVGITNSAESEPPNLHFRPQFRSGQQGLRDSAERVNSRGTEAGSQSLVSPASA